MTLPFKSFTNFCVSRDFCLRWLSWSFDMVSLLVKETFHSICVASALIRPLNNKKCDYRYLLFCLEILLIPLTCEMHVRKVLLISQVLPSRARLELFWWKCLDFLWRKTLSAIKATQLILLRVVIPSSCFQICWSLLMPADLVGACWLFSYLEQAGCESSCPSSFLMLLVKFNYIISYFISYCCAIITMALNIELPFLDLE